MQQMCDVRHGLQCADSEISNDEFANRIHANGMGERDVLQ
jgi:hypothetical protein